MSARERDKYRKLVEKYINGTIELPHRELYLM